MLGYFLIFILMLRYQDVIVVYLYYILFLSNGDDEVEKFLVECKGFYIVRM